jgi:hypothetical protein
MIKETVAEENQMLRRIIRDHDQAVNAAADQLKDELKRQIEAREAAEHERSQYKDRYSNLLRVMEEMGFSTEGL